MSRKLRGLAGICRKMRREVAMAFYDRDGSVITPERVLALVGGDVSARCIGLFDADDNQLGWVNTIGQAGLLEDALELPGVYWVFYCASCGTYDVMDKRLTGVCHNYWHDRPWLKE